MSQCVVLGTQPHSTVRLVPLFVQRYAATSLRLAAPGSVLRTLPGTTV